MAVYLLHFAPAYKHARHYLGYSDDARLVTRIEEHGTAHGARLCQVAAAAGCELLLVRLWPGADRSFERSLKRGKNSPTLCPLCNTRLHHLELPTIYGGAA